MLHLKSRLKRTLLRLRGLIPLPMQSWVFGVPKAIERTADYCRRNNYPFIFVSPPVRAKRDPPETPEKQIHWKFGLQTEFTQNFPSVWLCEIPNAITVGADAHVLSQDRSLLIDASIQFGLDDPRKHSLLASYLSLPHPRKLAGRSTIVSGPTASGYFHWLTDALPRLKILTLAGYELSTIDHFMIPDNSLSAIAQSLDVLGIDPRRLRRLGPRSCLRAEQLILPGMPGHTGWPPPWVREYLRNSFLPVAAGRGRDGPRRFYISRTQSRRILNESEIYPLLNEYGISIIQPEELGFLDQVELFANAELIVSPHGAGLTNLMFSPPTAKVVEIFSPNYVNICFYAIACLGGMRYSYLEGEGERPPSQVDPHLIRQDITISPERLRNWLSEWT